MKIGGFVKNSFVDYPGEIASVIFVVGCNMNCYYCHNKHLLNGKMEKHIEEKDIFEFLSSRKKLIDGVVISGGEPTLQEDLIEYITKIKNLGFKIKLDTNGTNFEVVKKLIENKLIDYIAVDIKAPLEKYSLVTNLSFKIEQVKKTIEYIINSDIKHEFRTTFCSKLKVEDIEKISRELKGASAYYIQKCNEEKDIKTKEEIILAQDKAKKYLENVFIRGI